MVLANATVEQEISQHMKLNSGTDQILKWSRLNDRDATVMLN